MEKDDDRVYLYQGDSMPYEDGMVDKYYKDYLGTLRVSYDETSSENTLEYTIIGVQMNGLHGIIFSYERRNDFRKLSFIVVSVDNTKIIVFYPVDGVSPMQKHQMNTQEGNNVNVCAIEGNFDDAQSGVKAMFNNKELAATMQKYKLEVDERRHKENLAETRANREETKRQFDKTYQAGREDASWEKEYKKQTLELERELAKSKEEQQAYKPELHRCNR